jgi:hypothetical protein
VLDTLAVAYAVHAELADGSIVQHGPGDTLSLVTHADQAGPSSERSARGRAD